MKGFVSAAFAVVLLAASAVAQDNKPRINSPNSLTQCQPTQLTWSGGVPPYIINVLPGGQPAAAPLKSFPKTSDTALTWIVDLEPAAITIEIIDAQGAQGFTAAVNINIGDRACLNSPTSAIPAAASSTAESSAAPSGSAGASGSKGSSATGSAATPSASTKPNSASSMAQNVFAAVGLSGLVAAALL